MNIEQLRDYCLSLPATSEAIKYGDQLCFMVLGKYFCSSRLPALTTFSFKVPDDQFDALCDRPGIVPAPYGGAKFKWVQATDFEALTKEEWEHYLRQAYEEVKRKLPKKVQEELARL